MNGEGGFFEGLVWLIRAASDVFWTLAAMLLDLARTAGPIKCIFAVGVVMLFGLLVSFLMQSRLNKKLGQEPGEPVHLFWHEAIFTLPGLIIWLMLLPFLLVARLIGWGVSSVQGAMEKRRERREEAQKQQEGMFADLDGEGDDGEAAPAEPARDEPRTSKEGADTQAEQGEGEDEELDPVLVASLGPSFMGAAVLCALLYLLGLVTEPLVRLQMGLSEGMPAWEFLLLGDRPELQWYVPLSRYPWMGGALTVFFWMFVWWWTARIMRLMLFRQLGANLIAQVDARDVLPWWRTWFGAPMLWRPDPTYVRWAKWLPLASAPFLVWSWAMLGADPYRMSPSMFSVSLLLTFGWALHYALEGVYRPDEREEEEPEERAPIVANTWEEVLEDVASRFQIEAPTIFEPPRPIEPLAFSTIDPSSEGIVSPLLTELLPEPGEFTHMQYVVLRTLSLLGYIHTDPPLPRGELDLGAGPAGLEDAGGRHRNQIVLAPEGTGKSTMAMLAACNHAIIHTRCTLIVTRDEERALSLFQQIRTSIEPSTLRWNIRERPRRRGPGQRSGAGHHPRHHRVQPAPARHQRARRAPDLHAVSGEPGPDHHRRRRVVLRRRRDPRPAGLSAADAARPRPARGQGTRRGVGPDDARPRDRHHARHPGLGAHPVRRGRRGPLLRLLPRGGLSARGRAQSLPRHRGRRDVRRRAGRRGGRHGRALPARLPTPRLPQRRRRGLARARSDRELRAPGRALALSPLRRLAPPPGPPALAPAR